MAEDLFREVTGNRVSGHFARNSDLMFFAKIDVPWILSALKMSF